MCIYSDIYVAGEGDGRTEMSPHFEQKSRGLFVQTGGWGVVGIPLFQDECLDVKKSLQK